MEKKKNMKEELIEAFPTGEVRYIQQEDDDKGRVVVVKLEEGLLMKLETYNKWFANGVQLGDTLKLTPLSSSTDSP